MYNTLDKDGFYRLNEKRIITRDMYISYLGKLTKKELLKLQETLIKYRNLDNKVGDIIVYCDDYYVISDISEELELYKLKEDNTNFVIGIKDKTYAVSKEKIVVPKIQKLVYTGYSLESISFQKEIKDYRGCIINYKNKLYYVYGVNSNKLNCFRVVQNEECLEQFRIVSDANIYGALWNNKKNILVDANYEIVDQVSKEEIEKTKDNKKRALKQVCRHPASNPGANWVVRKNSAANKYIVVRRVDDILYLVDINDLRIGIFDNIIIDDASDYKSLYKLNEIKRLSFFESDTNYDTAKEKCYILSKQNAISEQ